MSDNHHPDRQELNEARLTAFALEQLDVAEHAAVEAEIADSSELRHQVDEIRDLAGHVQEAARQEPLPEPSPPLRDAVIARLDGVDYDVVTSQDVQPTFARKPKAGKRAWLPWVAAACVLLMVGGTVVLGVSSAFHRPDDVRQLVVSDSRPLDQPSRNGYVDEVPEQLEVLDECPVWLESGLDPPYTGPAAPTDIEIPSIEPVPESPDAAAIGNPDAAGIALDMSPPLQTYPQKRQYAEMQGRPSPRGPDPSFRSPDPTPRSRDNEAQHLSSKVAKYREYIQESKRIVNTQRSIRGRVEDGHDTAPGDVERALPYEPAPGSEQYDQIYENEFLPVSDQPLSTLSIDVDTASYANVRRFLNDGRLPPSDAVRIEELINYFQYRYPQPEGKTPFSAHMEVAQCPWQGDHLLLKVGLKGREIEREQRGLSNLVFLLDVSGSMSDDDKLPLVKQAMRLLVQQLSENDRVAIVTYASNAGLRLESTCGEHKDKILQAIDGLRAGGSTHGSAGIQMAYQQAAQHFIKEGVNRVILCTDGDLNVGITQDDDLVKFIEEKAKTGVFLTVMGFGTGNLKDSKMEKLADKGNGVYAYIDSVREARKVLVEQMTGSLVTIAKDVKIQIEFNPAEVAAYRLIGYENRVLAAQDFDDDTKDAGEIGAGHTVTALYELVPAGLARSATGGRPLKYQRVPDRNLTNAAESGELLTLRLRYKEPEGKQSKPLEFVAKDEEKRFGQASPDFQFAAAVAAFGMLLRGSQYAGDATLAAVEEYAVSGLGDDAQGYRAEFVDLVRRARQLAPR